tara:strand:+ start:1614 stop:2714 length:1101 start_codon:yes stop_codon:yes gene_type:complete
MKKNDTKKEVQMEYEPIQKMSSIKLIDEINLNLNNIQTGKVAGISNTMKLIDQFYRLNEMQGLITASFFSDELIKTNSFQTIDFEKQKQNNNIRYKKFVDLCLIPTLKTSKDKMAVEEPFKYETLREISQSLLNCLKNKIISYNLIIDNTGKETKTCFTSPVGSKPVEIEIKNSIFNKDDRLKKRFNPKGSTGSSVSLSFEKLKSLSQSMLEGISSRTSSSDPTSSKLAEDLEEMKTEISSNIAFEQVELNATKKVVNAKTGKEETVVDVDKINLQKQRRKKQVENFVYVIEETVTKLVAYAEFKSIQRIALFIAMNKDFANWQKKNYSTSLNFNSSNGNQVHKVDMEDLDLDNEKLIASRLKAKQ